MAAIAVTPSLALPLGLFTYAAYFAMGTVLFALMLAANRFLGRGTPFASFVADYAVALMLSLYISWASLRSLPATMFGRRRVFERTPKQGVAGTSG